MRPKRPRFAGVGERRRDMVDGVGYVGEDEIGEAYRSPRPSFATARLRDSPPTKSLNRPQLAEQGQ
jgi:hypothetical protein